MLHGNTPEDRQGAKPNHGEKGTPEYSLVESIHASEKRVLGERCPPHTFEVGSDITDLERQSFIRSSQVTLEPSSYTNEKYELFEIYQSSVHNDRSSPLGFKRFLVETPLMVCPLPP